jgi:hypothetical protein
MFPLVAKVRLWSRGEAGGELDRVGCSRQDAKTQRKRRLSAFASLRLGERILRRAEIFSRSPTRRASRFHVPASHFRRARSGFAGMSGDELPPDRRRGRDPVARGVTWKMGEEGTR